MCLGVVLFGSNLFETLCPSWTRMSISFTKLGKFSFIIFSNNFSIYCFSSLLGTLMFQMLVHLKLSQRFLICPCFFEFFFLSTVLIECFFLPCVPNRWFDSWLHPLHCWFPVDFSLFHLV